jgi:cytochrome P450
MTTRQAPIQYPFPPAPSLYRPTETLTELREEQPVVQIQFPDGKVGWLVTRYDDVRQVLIDPRFSRAAAANPEVAQVGLGALAVESIIGMDPPEHTRLRRLVMRAFTARRVERLRPRVAELVEQLIDDMQALPQPVDLVAHFSLPLPVAVICELLGVPASDQHVFHAASDTVMGDMSRDPGEMMVALNHLTEYLAALIAKKRAAPADDLMTALIAARDDEDRLSERELVILCVSLLIAGHETTANQINMFLLTLLQHPDQLAKLRSDPTAVPEAVEELMRFTQLGDAGAGMPRVTTEAVQLSGVTIPAGAAVFPALVSANRDPRMFADPDRLDLTRGEVQFIGFGAGIHHCLGAQLARLELQEALGGLLRRMPNLRVVVPDSELPFKPGMLIRSLESLPVTW